MGLGEIPGPFLYFMVYTEKDYLMHYGVKGMKWGIRKDRNRKPSNLVGRNDFDKMKKYNMVIVGEIHNNSMVDYYDRLLSAKKPEYFICEFADTDRCLTKKELKDRMKNATNGATSGVGADYQYNYWAYELAYKHGCKLIGCNNPNFKKSSRMHDEDAAREQYMLDVLKEFQGKNAVVQLGDHHLRSIPIDHGFLNYTGDTKDDRGIVSDLTVDNASPIWEYFKNRTDTCISREPNEYDTELKYVKSHLRHSDELYHYGVKGMKWGVHKERPSAIHKRAKEKEPKITQDIFDCVFANGCEMHGLENRLKSVDSISRKSKLGKQVNDAVRYTAILPDESFVKKYKAIKYSMEKKGYTEIKCKNYFQEYRLGNVNHKAVQCSYKDKDGYIFEMQFQTKASQKAKDKKVPLYEEARDPNTSEERKTELIRQMRQLADNVYDPPGIDKIKSY